MIFLTFKELQKKYYVIFEIKTTNLNELRFKHNFVTLGYNIVIHAIIIIIIC